MSNTQSKDARTPKVSKNQWYNKLHHMPQITGIIIMIFILIASIYVGNWRTLSHQVAQAENLLNIEEAVQMRAGEASNMLALAGRNNIPQAAVDALTKARDALTKAQGGHNISVADIALQEAMAEVESALRSDTGLSEEDRTNVQRVRDNFDSAGNMMRQRAREYNLEIERARTTYRSLPFRFALPEPQSYEGVGT